MFGPTETNPNRPTLPILKRAFSHDVTVAILVKKKEQKNNETAARLEYQGNPLRVEHVFLCKRFLLLIKLGLLLAT